MAGGNDYFLTHNGASNRNRTSVVAERAEKNGHLADAKHRQSPRRRHRIEIDDSIGNRWPYRLRVRFLRLSRTPTPIATSHSVAIAAFATAFHQLSVRLHEVIWALEILAVYTLLHGHFGFSVPMFSNESTTRPFSFLLATDSSVSKAILGNSRTSLISQRIQAKLPV